MARSALINRRPWLLFAIVAALAFYFLQNSQLGGVWLTLIKGAAVGSLALYAGLRHRSRDATLLALALGCAAVGDIVIRFSLQAGGIAFFVAHGFAIALFLRNRRPTPGVAMLVLCFIAIVGIALASGALANALLVALYGAALGAMAVLAYLSRFPRTRVAVGAALFVLSDLLIFADQGNVMTGALADLLIWPFYFVGQFLIATGVIQTLQKDTSGATF